MGTYNDLVNLKYLKPNPELKNKNKDYLSI